jgi:succinate dehydrogenase / fumarate reductase cytochrome b subunit
MSDVREALMVGRGSSGKPVARPLSPHLQVYRLPLIVIMSITHRITGVGLAIGTFMLVWWLIAAATSGPAYDTVSWFLRTPVGYLLLFGWSVALWYHFCSGLRHLGWDFGQGFELVEAHASNRMVLIGTALFTVLTWGIGLAVQ